MQSGPQLRSEVRARLSAASDAALLVPERILRRIVKVDRDLRQLGLQVPHDRCYVVRRDVLLAHIDEADELDIPDLLAERVILISEPHVFGDERAPHGLDEALYLAERALFHGAAHVALEDRTEAFTPALIRARVDHIGQIPFDEVRAVLHHEELLLPPAGDRWIYEEFVATWLELRRYEPDAVPEWFTTIGEPERIDALIAEDVDPGAIAAASRVEGADAFTPAPPAEDHRDPADEQLAPPSQAAAAVLAKRARSAVTSGNHVRAAVMLSRAGRVDDKDDRATYRSEAEEALAALAKRLAAAVGEGAHEASDPDAWTQALRPLLGWLPRGFRTSEALLLYDLQKAAVDSERDVYAVDLVEWVLSAFRRPIKRPLPNQLEVRLLKPLRAARGRLNKIRVGSTPRRQLAALLDDALHHVERRLRERLAPLIEQAIDQVGLEPSNLPERVARAKLAQELLDRVVVNGFARMSDLRDVIAKNALKMPNLGGPEELLRGDPLLAADKALREPLDGVYRRGESYMRFLQRLSSLPFGTRIGRLLTLYLFLPFGGAFIVLEGLTHMVGPLITLFGGPKLAFLDIWTFLFTGIFTLALLHLPPFRTLVWHYTKVAWRGLRYLFVQLPSRIAAIDAVQRVLASRPFRLLWRFGIKPGLVGGLALLILGAVGAPVLVTALVAGALFIGTNLLLNSRFGRRIEESVTDWLARSWRNLRFHILPGLFEVIVAFFKRMLEWIERRLYAVDEWLRFKGGENIFSLFIKATLGVIWFVLTYIIRIYVNLLIEPQVNPIKHFPVVTVAHKLMIPFLKDLTIGLVALLTPLFGTVVGGTLAGFTVFVLPGFFGFLVWELKENWKLYEQNRSRRLKTQVIGSHSETMLRFMRPGFHSGTVPKLYAKLRKAGRLNKAVAEDKLHDKLHHVAEDITRFFERELIELLHQSPDWRREDGGSARLSVGEVNLGANRLMIELKLLDGRGDPGGTWIAFEEQSGWLVASVPRPGWLSSLEPREYEAFGGALVGFYKLAGADLVRDQIRALLGVSWPYDIADDGIVVWPGDDYFAEVVYRIEHNHALLVPHWRDDERATTPLPTPTIERADLLFSHTELTWAEWVEAWSGDGSPRQLLMSGFRVLPLGTAGGSGHVDEQVARDVLEEDEAALRHAAGGPEGAG